MSIDQLRKNYHVRVGTEIIRITRTKVREYANFADGSSSASRMIAQGIIRRLGCVVNEERISGQSAGRIFEQVTRDFVRRAFGLLHHLRPGAWRYHVESAISEFDQFEHLSQLERTIAGMQELAAALGTDYIIKPDIVVSREPVTDDEVNQRERVLEATDAVARLTPLRRSNAETPLPILHASISCKWTLRSDRAQNARAEALNLIRNRKGHLPHIVAVTAEPLPTRIAALALGTGDLDCVYHFALYELIESIGEIENEDQLDMLNTLIDGRRLRDISDLPFDLAI